MRIGLTGANGVLGRHLQIELARNGDEVISFNGDVRNAETVMAWVQGLNLVVHSAAIVQNGITAKYSDEVISTNVSGTANVACAVGKHERCHLTYISTSHVYSAKETPIVEDDPTQPLNAYGLSKLQGEQWVHMLASRYLIVRIFSFFDRFQQKPFLFPSLRDRILAAPANGILNLSGAHCVRDVAEAKWMARVCTAMAMQQQEGIVNCGTGEGHTVLSIANAMAQAMGRTDVTWQVSETSDDNTFVADVKKLTSRLGQLPPFDLAAAIAMYVSQVGP